MLGLKPRHGSHTRERGPCGFGGVGEENHAALAEWGPCGGDTADGAGRQNHRLLLLFLRYGTPEIQTGVGGRRKDCVHLWVF